MNNVIQNDQKQIFERALGIEAPWQIETIEFDEKAEELNVHVDFPSGSRFRVQEAEAGIDGSYPAYDTEIKQYRHLNFFQFQCILHVRIPRVKLPDGRTRTIVPPWAGNLRGFTLMFEAFILLLGRRGMTFTDAARTAKITQYQAQEIIVGSVAAAAEKRDLSAVEAVCIDETSKSRGHAYITLVADTKTHAVIDVQPGRGSETIAAFCATLAQHGGAREKITDVCVDMSPAFLKGIAEYLPRAFVTIDKFHVIQHAHVALDKTRRREGKNEGTVLKGMRWVLQKSHESLSAAEHDDLNGILRRMTSLRTARAWMYKEQLRNILSHTNPGVVDKLLRRWCASVMRSKVEPMKDVVRMIRRHWDQIVNWTRSRITNGFLESLNGVFQTAKRKARGFQDFRTIRAVIFLLSGKLDFTVVNPHVLPI